MNEYDELPEVIPVFPLPGAVLLPGTHLPLHIFEARYRAMIEDALEDLGLVGMIQPRAALGLAPGAPPLDLARVGCVGRLAQVARTDDGRFLIVLEGLRRFEPVAEELGRSGYRRVRVRWAEPTSDAASSWAAIDAGSVLASLSRWLAPGPGTEALAELEPGHQINLLSASLPFGEAEKQALIEAPDLAARRELLLSLLDMGFGDDEGTPPSIH